jgi:hypothetical protein
VLDTVRTGVDFSLRLPGYLRRIIDLDRGTAEIQRRLERRAAEFLALMRDAVYSHPATPYRSLLAAAGCDMGDLERLVRDDGLEGALTALRRGGVYLTIDEFKGRQPVVRGSLRLQVTPSEFRNPLARQHVMTASGGSRGQRVPVTLDLRDLHDRALHTLVPILAQGGAEWAVAVWKVPGGALPTLLQYAVRQTLPARWYLMGSAALAGVPARYRWSAWAAYWVSRVALRPLPAGESVSLGDPGPILRWMRAVLRAGGTPYLDTFPGAAVELCRSARAAGVELAGARLSLPGEPLTEARLATIRATGADAVSRYSTSETGPLGGGCLAPATPDEQHVFEDGHAVIQPGDDPAGRLPADALLVTSLRRSASLLCLNVALGDRGDLSERRCGCPLERVGWRRHLSGIRSYEKLTAHGMTFHDIDVIRVLEETLPARFGGGPNDYQLVEAVARDGRPRLILRVHPRVPARPLEELAQGFLEAVSGQGPTERLMGQVWREGHVVEVIREEPVASTGGKILHVIGR